MVTERLYYSDSYTTRFKANIIDRVKYRKRLAIVLDKSYFYPESGGQPNDQGEIAGIPVDKLAIREDDDAILHIMAGEVWENESVFAKINWERRFDHMQQHSGQHILSQAFMQIAGLPTVGFHLGESLCAIDLPQNALSPSQIEQTEMLANQIIWENRPVTSYFVSRDEAKKLQLRKIPEIKGDQLRVVEIEDFDLNACGGTHVKSSGEVGIIKLLKFEKKNDQIRVSFLCGKRALLDYRQKNGVISRLVSELTTGEANLPHSVAKLGNELKSANKELKQTRRRLLEVEAAALLDKTPSQNGVRIIRQVLMDWETKQARILGSLLTKEPNVIALLGIPSVNSHLLFVRSDESPGKMDDLLKVALQSLGAGGGGGNEKMAQGGGAAANVEQMNLALQRAERVLSVQL